MVAFPKLLLLWTVLFFLVYALPMVFNPKYIMAVIKERVDNVGLLSVFGLVLLVIGFLYLLVYAKLDGTWYMIFAILGYITLLKGVIMMCLPKFGAKTAKRIYSTTYIIRIMGLFLLIASAFILWAVLMKF